MAGSSPFETEQSDELKATHTRHRATSRAAMAAGALRQALIDMCAGNNKKGRLGRSGPNTYEMEPKTAGLSLAAGEKNRDAPRLRLYLCEAQCFVSIRTSSELPFTRICTHLIWSECLLLLMPLYSFTLGNAFTVVY